MKLRILRKYEEKCQGPCGGFRLYKYLEIDHIVALANWNKTPEAPHGNRESNLHPLCDQCHTQKTKKDVAEKALTDRKVKKRVLKKKKSRFRGWRRMDGTIVWNDKD